MEEERKKQVISLEEASALASKIQEQFAEKAQEAYPPPLKFWALKGLGNPEVLKVLGTPLRKWIPLHAMVDRISSGSKCIFWQTVFEQRDYIPHDELLKVWYTYFDSSFAGAWWIKVDAQDNHTDYYVPWDKPDKLAVSVVTHPLLIDNPTVCQLYVKARKPGYRFLRCITGRSTQSLHLSTKLEQALLHDDTPSFEILRLMEQKRITYTLLEKLLLNKSTSILRYLVENDLIPKDVMSLGELCCTCATQYPDTYSVPLLNTIEEARPGTVKSVLDDFGRNLLWYALHNRLTGWFHPNCKLTKFLLEKGCDPDNQNQVGLSWQEVTDGLTLQQKTKLMTARYTYRPAQRYDEYARMVVTHSEELKKAQPLNALEAP